MQTIEKYRHLSSKTLFAVDRWNKDKTNEIAKFRNHKETSAEYQNFIQQVPEAIRDLCVIKSLNYLYELKEPIVVNKNGFF